MAYILIGDDWYTGYYFDAYQSPPTPMSSESLHEVPDEIVRLLKSVRSAYADMQALLELMDKVSRK